MRVLKILTIAGLVLAVTGTAGAVGIPFANGPLVMHLTNYDDGTVYTRDLKTGGQAALSTWYNASDLVSAKQLNPATFQAGEDNWGIFQIDQILTGHPTGGNIIAPDNTIYQKSSDPASLAIVGIFFGAHDVRVMFNADGSQTIDRTGDKFMIWTETQAQLAAIMPLGFGSLGDTARLSDYQYKGIGFDTAGNPLPGAELVLTGNTEVGMAGDTLLIPGGGVFGFQSNFTPQGVSGTGNFNGYVDIGPVSTSAGSQTGTDNQFFNTNGFPESDPGSAPFIPGSNADVHLKGDTSITSYSWLVSSSDPLMTNAVPEPVTMLGLFLSIGGIGAYIRRRRMAA